jgi:4-azaleucine resistance transporter AzlC
MRSMLESPRPRSTYAAGARAILPLSPAVALFGASFGVLAQSAGFDPWASIVMSATTFAGSAQFAALSVLGAGGTALAAIAAAVLLNARYGPMGLAAAKAFRGGSARRVLESQLLVDESWALAQQGGRFEIRRMLGAGFVLYACWVGGTALGVAVGSSVGDPATLGLDAAFPALFLALLVPLVNSRRALAAALAGGGIALLLTPITPAGVPVIAATCGVLFGLLPERQRGHESREHRDHSAPQGRPRPGEAAS